MLMDALKDTPLRRGKTASRHVEEDGSAGKKLTPSRDLSERSDSYAPVTVPTSVVAGEVLAVLDGAVVEAVRYWRHI